LWFVTTRGLTIVDPRLLSTRRPPIHVDIEGVAADDRPVNFRAAIALPPGTNKLQVDYTAPNLTFPLKTHFRYRLEGFDADWIDAGTRRQALYTNLPARVYRFRVMADDEEGNWLESDVAWNFSIRPMFYQTVWFDAICLIALAGIMWAAWEVRVRQLRREFSLVLGERVRLSQELHDTLLQSLVGVALQFDAVSKDLDSSPATAKALVVRIREQVEEYIREARRSIWALRSPALDARNLTEALQEAGERAASGNPVQFTFTASGVPSRYPADVEHQLLRIGQEAVLNAVHHAHARQIRMDLQYRDNALALRVSDDGIGFDPDRRRDVAVDHYGITTMRERAQQIGGAMTIESARENGTVIEIVVPLGGSRGDA
jgi:signal transduction histidine kinase